MSEKDTYSEPPLNTKYAAQHRVSFADVAMRFIQDIPLYIIIVIIGVLAIRGTADARDFIITGLGSLLAKSWPKPIRLGDGGPSLQSVAPYVLGVGMLAKCLLA